VFVIEREFAKASAFAATGAVLTFFGFMHGEQVGFAVTPSVAVAYAIVAAGLFALASAKPLAVRAPSAAPAE
jgi:AGZA family xanthine/uracil permease-like MFS transporter